MTRGKHAARAANVRATTAVESAAAERERFQNRITDLELRIAEDELELTQLRSQMLREAKQLTEQRVAAMREEMQIELAERKRAEDRIQRLYKRQQQLIDRFHDFLVVRFGLSGPEAFDLLIFIAGPFRDESESDKLQIFIRDRTNRGSDEAVMAIERARRPRKKLNTLLAQWHQEDEARRELVDEDADTTGTNETADHDEHDAP